MSLKDVIFHVKHMQTYVFGAELHCNKFTADPTVILTRQSHLPAVKFQPSFLSRINLPLS